MREVPSAADEPLEGDIGPASGAASGAGSGPAARPGAPEAGRERTEAAEALRRFDAEREERRRGTDAVAGRIAVVLAALFLAFLTYDSARTAVEAHSRGDDWLYPPGVVGGACALGLIALLTWAWRRRRLGM
ncbi:hypothetical protein [Actinomadura sp. K4S16]|uniref:hypothetical protein n=1 Tax=Actinomadura sp. K4S16 TaxID=1316147 RepID=UPI0011EF8A69|nr:hypothetical protein [Actinomadura sp. K4S16]